MPDISGYRANIGIIIPSTNTMVEADVNDLRAPGVSFHAGRMYVEQPALDSDDAFTALLGAMEPAFEVALRDVLTCQPDGLIMAMSAPTFWGGAAGNAAFLERAAALTDLPVVTAADSCRAALEALGARRIAVLTPYPIVMREQIVRYFRDVGFSVLRSHDLGCESATAIARVPPEQLRRVVRGLDGPDVDAIVQAGTNLPMLGLAARLEAELGKPVLAINAALVWHAYREMGFLDRIEGAGRLLAEH